MTKHITIKIALILISLILCGFVAIYVFDVSLPANAKFAGRDPDQLYDSLGIVKIPPGENPVEIHLQDLYGKIVGFSDFRGKIVFLNFWATWCPTCVVEMPAMEKLYRKLNDKAFTMVTISVQDSVAAVQNFFKKNKLTFTGLIDSTGATLAGFGIRAIPTTFILDKTGRIIGMAMGSREWDSRKSIALFEYLIDRNAATPASIPAQSALLH